MPATNTGAAMAWSAPLAACHADLPHLWTHRPGLALAQPGALPDVPDVLEAPWGRAPAPAAPAAGGGLAARDAAALHPLWATDLEPVPRAVQTLLQLLAPDW